ncbi:septal ring lytic transglycosylase RlpA family protein [Phreatobacter oligotrophus]|uniref:Endolytic peptidoglycan transglycosylase RlpA n=1 Tax=Phreatobacter oligotrophus TaxID=1122261 RepID=A0A2T4Z569_9HYPH|nr:septal ring lytic transglycosylase RlpA family protein [Phreatobacter oligotrophus]PTM57044.1 rare lipoprotein A [Phreatobacter oligotrophus]
MNSSAIGEGLRVSVSAMGMRHRVLACTALCGLGLALGGCNSQTASSGGPVDRFNSQYGVSSSPRVVADGESVPRGGGVYRVGRPYRVAGRTYTPFEKREGHTESGIASWYGRQFHGRLTANGEVYDMNSLSAAHRTMPMPSYARVTNLTNGHSLIVRVNDRGPFHGNRVIDLSHRASHLLNFRGQGLARVRVEYVGRAPIEGSDDRMLLATLRTDGSPAPRPVGGAPATMIASAAPQTVPDPAPRPAPAAATTPVAIPVAAAPLPAPQEQPAQGFAFFRQDTTAAPSAPGAVNPDLVQPNPFAPTPAPVAAAPVAASAPITMASAPLPMERPGLREAVPAAPVATTVVARSNAPAQVAPATVTVVATPAPTAAPQPSAPVLATASSRPVTVPAANAFAPPRPAAPAIAAMPGGAPVRASLGFGSLY